MIGQLFLETLHLLILADKNTEFFVNEEYFVNSFKNREIKTWRLLSLRNLFFGCCFYQCFKERMR